MSHKKTTVSPLAHQLPRRLMTQNSCVSLRYFLKDPSRSHIAIKGMVFVSVSFEFNTDCTAHCIGCCILIDVLNP
jgi:hypothetical protein